MTAFMLSKQLETIEFKDGDRAYCRPCDGMAQMEKSRPSYVKCRMCGTEQHAGNLVVNGSHRTQPRVLAPEDMPPDPEPDPDEQAEWVPVPREPVLI